MKVVINKHSIFLPSQIMLGRSTILLQRSPVLLFLKTTRCIFRGEKRAKILVLTFYRKLLHSSSYQMCKMLRFLAQILVSISDGMVETLQYWDDGKGKKNSRCFGRILVWKMSPHSDAFKLWKANILHQSAIFFINQTV